MPRRPPPAGSAGTPTAVRITAGRWRGRKLPVVGVEGLRPTPERLRETLFNWLQWDIAELNCLDLYAGTGALGFEALSRGAAQCTFVDRNAQVRATLQANAARLGAQAQCQIVGQVAVDFLAQTSARYDLVFVDPPFAAQAWEVVLKHLPRCLKLGARVYLERPSGYSAPWLQDAQDPSWVVLRESRAGGTLGTLLAHQTGGLSS